MSMSISNEHEDESSYYDIYKTETSYSYSSSDRMNWIIGVAVVVGVVVLLVLLCRCCCSSKKHGRVLAPPVDNSTAQPAAYPQQQYATPYLAAAGAGPYYAAPAPYPTQHAVPLHAPPVAAPPGTIPARAPYPRQHYVYAEAVSPYPPAVAAPYPTHSAGVYPHPHPHPYPQHQHQPQPANAPTDSCPPSYDLVMGGFEGKQPPYNPNAPH